MTRVLVYAGDRSHLEVLATTLSPAGLDVTGMTDEHHVRMALEARHGAVLLLAGGTTQGARDRLAEFAATCGVPVIDRFGPEGPAAQVHAALAEAEAVVAPPVLASAA